MAKRPLSGQCNSMGAFRDDVLLQKGIGSWFIGSENRQRTLIISFLYNLTASVVRRFLGASADRTQYMDSPTVLTHNTKLLLPLFTISHYLPSSKATGNQFRYSFLCFLLNNFCAVPILTNFILYHNGELDIYSGIYCDFLKQFTYRCV